jgi:hypothetical protein
LPILFWGRGWEVGRRRLRQDWEEPQEVDSKVARLGSLQNLKMKSKLFFYF